MSSDISVYGKRKEDRDWMRENHRAADILFRKRHPVYEGVVKNTEYCNNITRIHPAVCLDIIG